MTRTPLPCLVAIFAAAVAVHPAPGQEPPDSRNLQVLPSDIPEDELTDTMLGFLQALGLPRRGGEGCLHCHVGDLERPRSEWDWSNDAKSTKLTARRMIAMTKAINEEHLAGLARRMAPEFEVGCVTCHRGRVDPRPLPMLLDSALRAGGADSVATVYRELYGRFFGADAYDFRVSVLAGMAAELAAQDDYEAALRISAVNEQAHPAEPGARRVTLGLGLQRTLDREGADAAIAEFTGMLRSEPPGIVDYSLLDGLGWRTYRLDRQADALPLFRANRAAFPDLYFTFESLTEASLGAGEISLADAIRAYQDWLTAHPGHEMAQVQLTNLQRRR